MASIPQYESPQVEARPLGEPKNTSLVTPDLLDYPARQAEATGAALASAGTGLVDVAKHMQQRENADLVFRTEVAARDDYIKYEQDVRQNRKGRFAKDLTDDTNKWWEENLAKYAGGLANDEQRRLFAKRVEPVRRSSLHSMSEYESKQLEDSHDDSWRADKNLTISTAAATPTIDNVDMARAELTRLNQYQGARKGWDGPMIQSTTLFDTTELHKQVLQQLAQTDPMAAQPYFEKYKSEIHGSLHAELGAFSQKGTANALGEAGADEVWKSIGPQTDREPASLDKMEDAIRTKFKGNELAMKAGVAALRDRTSAFDKGRKERDESTEADVWRGINSGATLPQIRAMPQFLSLDDKKQGAIIEHVENMAHTRTQREEADKAQRGFSAYLQYSNPDVLDKMSENQILNLTPILGNQLGGHLMEKKRALGGKIIAAGMDQQDFDHTAQDVGLRPYDPHKSESERASLGELKYNIEQAINSEQTRLKRPLQRDEKTVLMRRMMDDKVLRDRFYFFPSSSPAVLLNADQLKNAYVKVGGQEIQLSSIPPTDRAEIIRERQRRNLPVTEQAIAETWVAGKAKRPKSAAGSAGSY